jgi:hypothetical protein
MTEHKARTAYDEYAFAKKENVRQRALSWYTMRTEETADKDELIRILKQYKSSTRFIHGEFFDLCAIADMFPPAFEKDGQVLRKDVATYSDNDLRGDLIHWAHTRGPEIATKVAEVLAIQI